MTESSPNDIPRNIGGFEIIGTVGKGGMGDVYKARQTSLNRIVALKILPEEFSRNHEFAMRFDSEANVVSKLEHHNIVTIYDYGTDNKIRYLAMQYVEGENLGELIKRKGKLAPKDVVEISKQVLRALKYAHEKRVLHRDIKPQNILIDKNCRVLVTDFGIAKMFEQNKITNTGVVVGTPEYMSPEQAEGLELDQRTDIYSLGIVMYEMLSGRPPFQADTPLSIAYKHVNVPPEPLEKKVQGIPPLLEKIIMKSLKKDRETRYKNADEFLLNLDHVFDNQENMDTWTMRNVHLNISKVGFDEKRLAERREDNRRKSHERRTGDRRHEGLFYKIVSVASIIAIIITAITVSVYFLYKFFGK